MKRFAMAIAGAVAVLAISAQSAAAPPAWCKGATARDPDLKQLFDGDPAEVIKGFVAAECSADAEAAARHDDVAKARAAWSRRLGMSESDWADAVEYVRTGEASIHVDAVSKNLATAGPLDQYAIISNARAAGMDAMYATDMFESRLSELGRFAFLRATCLDANSERATPDTNGMLGTEVAWAICQADVERIDPAKLFAEIHADTAHDGALRMLLRLDAYRLPARLKAHASAVEQMKKRDEANRQLFAIAASARAEWASGVGKRTELLELVLAVESGQLAQSRKQLEGCGETTRAALAEAVSRVPAKAFAGMFDERDSPFAGFATKAGPLLGRSAEVNLAAIAFVACDESSGLSKFLRDVLADAPPMRGPRNAALARLRVAKLTYDNINAKLSFARAQPYGSTYLEDGAFQSTSRGGAVKTAKLKGERVTVEVDKTFVRQNDCVASHETNKVSRVRGDGTVEYQRICDRSATVVHDHTWTPFEFDARYAPALKPGVVFSATGADVIAVWPNKTAKVPSVVLGGAVK